MQDFPFYNHDVVEISNTGDALFCKEYEGSCVRKECLIFSVFSRYFLSCGDFVVAILAAKKLP